MSLHHSTHIRTQISVHVRQNPAAPCSEANGCRGSYWQAAWLTDTQRRPAVEAPPAAILCGACVSLDCTLLFILLCKAMCCFKKGLCLKTGHGCSYIQFISVFNFFSFLFHCLNCFLQAVSKGRISLTLVEENHANWNIMYHIITPLQEK